MTVAERSPSSRVDLYADEVLEDPWSTYKELRDLGPVVHVEPIDAYAIPRYAEAREVLRDWQRFTSVCAVSLNDPANEAFAGTVLASDPPFHDRLRDVVRERLSPAAIRKLDADVSRQADELVARLVEQAEFDAHEDLARFFPISVVADLIGLPDEGRERLMDWANAVFNAFGPGDNERTLASFPLIGEMQAYLAEVATRDRLAPGSMGLAIYEAADRGEIGPESCHPLLSAYVSAGMDTTINAIGSAMLLFGANPDQWAKLKADPALARSAINEVLRCEAPVQSFCRQATDAQEVAGSEIPAGAKVLVMFGSANRDERKYADPDTFDVTRNAIDHLSFGFGVHRCAGASLAGLEIEAILNALVRRVATIEIVGEPVRALNNATRGLHSLPVAVTAQG
ncbi:MAG: cytochrome P450 [Actinobacteria bacterium]|nr:cytochrome P450 [Actinomycetota bacterium]